MAGTNSLFNDAKFGERLPFPFLLSFLVHVEEFCCGIDSVVEIIEGSKVEVAAARETAGLNKT